MAGRLAGLAADQAEPVLVQLKDPARLATFINDLGYPHPRAPYPLDGDAVPVVIALPLQPFCVGDLVLLYLDRDPIAVGRCVGALDRLWRRPGGFTLHCG